MLLPIIRDTLLVGHLSPSAVGPAAPPLRRGDFFTTR